MESTLFTTLFAAMQTHAWPIVTGCIIGIVVLAALTPWGKTQWGKLPNVYHPYVPAVIGVLSAFGEALVAGKSWADAFTRDALPALLGVLYTMKSATHTEAAKPADEASKPDPEATPKD